MKHLTSGFWARTLAVTLSLGLVAGTAGCSVSGVGEKDSAKDANSSAGVKGDRTGKEILMYLSAGRKYNAYMDRIAKFEKDKGVKVTIQEYQWGDMQQKLTADFLSGNVPDITEESGGFWSTRFGQDGNVMPLDDFLAKENNFLDDFVQSAIEVRQAGGKTYAIPLHVTMNGLIFANAKMLEKAGVAMPTTWEEFRAAAKAIQASGVKWGAALNNDFSYGTPFILQAGVKYASEGDPLSPVENAIEAFQFQKDLVYTDKVSPRPVASNDYAGPRKLFTSGEAGMIITGPWDISAVYKEAKDFPLAVGQPLKGKEQKTTIAGSGLMIPAKSQNPELAWELIKALTEPEVQEAVTKEVGMAMSRKSWAETETVKNNPILSNVAKAREVAVVPNREYWKSPNIAKINDEDKALYEDIIINNVDVKTRVEKYNEVVKGLLK